MSKTFKIAYSTAIFALLLVVASPTWAIYDPEAQKNCTPNATETVCLMRKPVEKETILPVTMITSLTEAIVKSPLILAEKVELLQTLLSNLRKFLGQTEVTPSEKTSYTLEEEQGIFKDGEYSFNLGCNTIFGTYTQTGNQVVINPGASTKKACAVDLMKKDEQLVKDLAKLTRVENVDGNIILSGGGVELKIAAKNVSYNYNGGNATFANGQFSFRIGCNTIAGSYELKGDKVTINPGASTLMACSEDLMKKDEQLAKDLAKVVMLKEEGQDLILSGGDVEIKLVRSK